MGSIDMRPRNMAMVMVTVMCITKTFYELHARQIKSAINNTLHSMRPINLFSYTSISHTESAEPRFLYHYAVIKFCSTA